jgi:hypothetical protein
MTKKRKGSGFEPVDFTQRVLMDVLSTARSPDAHAVMLLDMSAAHAFRAEYQEQHGVALTDLHLVIKAVAQTLQHDPQLNSLVRGYRVQQPGSVDIGVSVATGRSVSPVIVINQAEEKSLRQIRDELQQKSARAVNIEKSGPPTWHKWARLAPAFLRRGVVRAMSSSVPVRRSKIGTVQITSVGWPIWKCIYRRIWAPPRSSASAAPNCVRLSLATKSKHDPRFTSRFPSISALSARAFAQNLSSFKRLMENPKLIKE